MTTIIIHGKSGGKFKSSDGNVISTYKVSAAVPTDQLDGDWEVLGYKCVELKVSKEVYYSLPGNSEAYEGGLLAEADFDYKGRVISLKTA